MFSCCPISANSLGFDATLNQKDLLHYAHCGCWRECGLMVVASRSRWAVVVFAAALVACSGDVTAEGVSNVVPTVLQWPSEINVWTSPPKLTLTPRWAHTANTVNNNTNVVVFGGYSSDVYDVLDDTWILVNDDSGREAWFRAGSLLPWGTRMMGNRELRSPAARWDHASATFQDSKVVVFGGQTVKTNLLDDVWMLDVSTPSLASWEYLVVPPNMTRPLARRGHKMVVLGDEIYVYGGLVNKPSDPEGWVAADDLWKLTISGNSASWAHIDILGAKPPARQGHTFTAMHGTSAILYGGFSNGEKYHTFSDVWRLDRAEDGSVSWEQLSLAGEHECLKRYYHGAVAYNETALMIVGGAVTEEGGITVCYNDTWLMHIDRKEWRLLSGSDPHLPKQKAHTLSLMNSSNGERHFRLFGGVSDTGVVGNSTYALNPGVGERNWGPRNVPIAAGPGIRFGHSTARFDHKNESNLFLFGGEGMQAEFLNDLWSMELQAWTAWSQRVPKGPSPPSRYGNRMVVLDETDEIMIFGGVGNDGQYLNDLWVFNIRSREWTEVSHSMTLGDWPGERLDFVGLAVNSTQFFIHGGLGTNSVSPLTDQCWNDTWIFDKSTSQWTNLQPSVVGDETLSPRAAHAGVLLRGQYVVIFGGKGPRRQLFNSTWIYDLQSNQWERLYLEHGPSARSGHTLVAVSESSAVLFGGLGETTTYNDMWLLQWRAADSRPGWTRLATPEATTPSERWGHSATALFCTACQSEAPVMTIYGGFQDDKQIFLSDQHAVKIGCNAGTYGNIITSCEPCQVETYGTLPGAAYCDGKCPKGTRTPFPGATSAEECTLCDPPGYCGSHGTCEVLAGRPMCTCSATWTGSMCDIPWVWLLGAGGAVVLGLIFATSVIMRRLQNAGRSLETLRGALTEYEYQDWEIDAKEVQLIRKIAVGGSAVIHKGTWNGKTVAVKEFVDDVNLRTFELEVGLMKQLRHPNVLLLWGACGNPVSIVTEYCPNGNLFDLIHSSVETVTPRRALQFAIDVARGMNYLHSRRPPVLHRDLKSANLLIGEDGSVKVADFGFSRRQAFDMNMSANVGTTRWMAPEVLQLQVSDGEYIHQEETSETPLLDGILPFVGIVKWQNDSTGRNSNMSSTTGDLRRVYGFPADVYSYGMVLFELATRQIPYFDLKFEVQVMRHILEGNRPELDELYPGTPSAFRDLINECWDHNPQARPSFSDILMRLELMWEDIDDQA